MGMVMGVSAVVLTVAAGLVGLMVWIALILPRLTAWSQVALVQRPARCLVVGIGTLLVIGLPAQLLLRLPHGLAKLIGWALSLVLVGVLVTGMAAMARLLGERLRSLSPSLTPLGGLVRGAITLLLAAIIPFLGWFLFAPLVGLTLTGAGVLGGLGCFRQRNCPPASHLWEGECDADREASMDGKPAATLLAMMLAMLLPAFGLLGMASPR